MLFIHRLLTFGFEITHTSHPNTPCFVDNYCPSCKMGCCSLYPGQTRIQWVRSWLQQKEMNLNCLLTSLGQVVLKASEFRFELQSAVLLVLVAANKVIDIINASCNH